VGADLEWTTPCTSSDLLHPSAIEPLLRTRLLGKQGIHYYEDLGSTNDRARELARTGCPEGTLVLANSQALGRGRLGKSWASPRGTGLYFSLVFRPPFGISSAPRITLLAGVAVCRAINHIASVASRIKWPNDILIHGKKVAGILTELEASGSRIAHVVLGIGVNVNTPFSAFPSELRGKATSLLAQRGRSVSRAALLGRILSEGEKWWEVLLSEGFQPVREAWRELSATLGKRVRAEGIGPGLVGTAQDIDEEGSLLIRSDDGMIHQVPFGEVSLLDVYS
jgi:BirA family transcriptional regulator, biotin operon repressor / biotin---[acetyl-CoA-carboxylase] ligase